jgi:hypothetical protein
MVKGEHLRPLLGFGAVCVTAALIMGTGLGTPSVTGIVAAPHVRAVPDTPALVLGQTLAHAATPKPASSAPDGHSTAPAAVERETAVLASLTVPAGASAAPSATASALHPTTSGKPVKHRKPHRNAHQVHHLTAVAKPHASTVPSAPTPPPASHPQPAPAPVPGHEAHHGAGHGLGHGLGHGIGHGIGHGSRGSTNHAAFGGHASGLVATVFDHRGRHAQHGSGWGSHGDGSGHSRGHWRHDGTDDGRGSGGHGGSWHGQHR